MNVYLDIDGVLLISENHASPYADEFIQAILSMQPESTYWLTTHCWRGENRTLELLSPVLDETTTEQLKLIKPTSWGELKTDAIDFSQPFLWFDDDLFDEEKAELEKNNALQGHVYVDLNKDPDQLRALTENYFTGSDKH